MVEFAGDDAQMVVRITGEPEVSWYHNDKLITDKDNCMIVDALNGDDQYYLVIKNGKLSDSGLYRCIARNASGETGCFAHVVVQQKTLEKNESHTEENINHEENKTGFFST